MSQSVTYYLVFMPTKKFAAMIAATATVVPKSAKESIVLPFQDTEIPAILHSVHGIKNTTAL